MIANANLHFSASPLVGSGQKTQNPATPVGGVTIPPKSPGTRILSLPGLQRQALPSSKSLIERGKEQESKKDIWKQISMKTLHNLFFIKLCFGKFDKP